MREPDFVSLCLRSCVFGSLLSICVQFSGCGTITAVHHRRLMGLGDNIEEIKPVEQLAAEGLQRRSILLVLHWQCCNQCNDATTPLAQSTIKTKQNGPAFHAAAAVGPVATSHEPRSHSRGPNVGLLPRRSFGCMMWLGQTERTAHQLRVEGEILAIGHGDFGSQPRLRRGSLQDTLGTLELLFRVGDRC